MEKGPLRSVLYALRSALGTNGIFERLTTIESQLRNYQAERAPDQVERKDIPITKMGSLNNSDEPAVLDYSQLTGDPPIPASPSSLGLGSRLCRQADFSADGFRYWISQMGHRPSMHRKLWEWYFAADALWRLGMLAEGRRGVGFGVGQEPLTALFAAHGCSILASDMDPERAKTAGWTETEEHASSLAALDRTGICPPQLLRERVQFRTVDMNQIPNDLGNFDFCWSSCSLEHLGSLRHGADFIVNAMRCLAPGGVAVHTTEFNMSSNDVTLESAALSLYRRCDIEKLVVRLENEGHRVERVDWSEGPGFADTYVDLPPYNSPMHLRLMVGQYRSTSIGLIIHAKGDAHEAIAT